MRWFRKLGLLLFGVALGLAAALYVLIPRWAERAILLPEAQVVRLEKGMSLKDLTAELEATGLIDCGPCFRTWIRAYRSYSQFQAGQYRFENQVSPLDIAQAIESGKSWEPFALQFVIPEGFTLKQVIERLLARNVGTREELEDLSKDASLLAAYNIPGRNLEGYLYPATYSFVTMPTARAAFEKMLQTFYGSIPVDLEAQLKEKKLSLHQAVIFASLIEKETQVDDERPFVSEVIWNRFKAGEPLGIDAALIYGIENYKGDIKWEHLRDPKNLYNNRIHKGLPPTPIGAISRESLLAVLNPSSLGYRFYVLRNDGSKRHHFTKSLQEHNVYVKQLIESSRRN